MASGQPKSGLPQTDAAVVAVSRGEYKVAQPSATEVEFFADTEHVVHVFDFDYDVIQAFQLDLAFRNGMACPIVWPCVSSFRHALQLLVFSKFLPL